MGVAGAIVGAGVLGAGASIFGGITASNAAKSAANTQASAAQSANATQLYMFNKTQQNLQPYVSGGQQAFGQLQTMTGTDGWGNPLTAPLTKPFAPTMAQLASTPGYQFTLQQGQQAVQNSFAAQGLGSSGAAIKGALGYAEGLASTTYQQQFANYWSQNQNIYNMLSGISTTGANAAANLGSTSQAVAAQVGANTIGAGNAQAAGIVGGANALTSGLIGAGNALTSGMYGAINYNMLNRQAAGGYVDQGSFT